MTLQNDWDQIIGQEFNKAYYKKMDHFLVEEYNTNVVYPDKNHIFTALKLTPFADVKVVIIGQDPYHGPNQAHGLCFSVLPGVDLPPSLRNIYKELISDMNCPMPNHGCLEGWAKQGVLLLNAVLTVGAAQASSHSNIGWECFTDEIIVKLNKRKAPVIFILWGNYARSKKKLITEERHFILEAVHPSPLSAYRGFFGSKPFSKTNALLKSIGEKPIDWQIYSLE
ncbi:MAG: uracil-DNA glycosylase [Firmicutes bacterium HGW-Firmicutes-7]|nr:MAG: uracil-DNA glycosylase [Firmicutes bacterium HGW-Firmicutes-7]